MPARAYGDRNKSSDGFLFSEGGDRVRKVDEDHHVHMRWAAKCTNESPSRPIETGLDPFTARSYVITKYWLLFILNFRGGWAIAAFERCSI